MKCPECNQEQSCPCPSCQSTTLEMQKHKENKEFAKKFMRENGKTEDQIEQRIKELEEQGYK